MRAMMAGLLSGAFIGTNGLELTSTATQDFTNGLPSMLAGTSSDVSTKPYAYLNYIVFDQNFTFKDGGAMRVPDAAVFDAGLEIAVQPQRVFFDQPISISQTGFIYVWVSNESANTQVWWDDLKVTHTGSRVTQATDYYAFGSVMREQSIATEPTYKFGYQGQYAEKDDETGWNHFELREFDPIIGRWLVPDPYGQYWSPYLAMGNNPINLVDPDGGYDGPGDSESYAEAMQQEQFNSIDQTRLTTYLQEVIVTAKAPEPGGSFQNLSWNHFGDGFGKLGQSFLDMGKNAWNSLKQTGNGHGWWISGGGDTGNPGEDAFGNKRITDKAVDLENFINSANPKKASGKDLDDAIKDLSKRGAVRGVFRCPIHKRNFYDSSGISVETLAPANSPERNCWPIRVNSGSSGKPIMLNK